jgi:hypothetical protein
MLGIDMLETSTQVPLCLVHVGACGCVPSRQGLNGVASKEPSCYGACPVLKSPWVARRIQCDLTGGKILPVHAYREGRRIDMVRSRV